MYVSGSPTTHPSGMDLMVACSRLDEADEESDVCNESSSSPTLLEVVGDSLLKEGVVAGAELSYSPDEVAVFDEEAADGGGCWSQFHSKLSGPSSMLFPRDL
ncbi:hypothetical protein PC116_g19352 [Phytophthora cactorum]|nr:hypothetical protein PC116_g19352 [Phytophthora cactorum]